MDISIPNSINIGSIQFNLYGLLLGIGFVIIYFNVDKRYSKQAKLVDYIFVLLSTVLGARLFFIFNNLERFFEEPRFIFQINGGGLALFGAFAGLTLSTYIVSRYRKIKYFELSDTIFTYVPLVQAIGRFGNYFNQELYGKPTDLPWAIQIDLENRLPGYEKYSTFHPTFIYEAILDIINFVILYKFVPIEKSGYRTAIFFINYAIIRLITNRIRIDKEYFGFIENSDLYALIALVGGIIMLYFFYRQNSQDTSPQEP